MLVILISYFSFCGICASCGEGAFLSFRIISPAEKCLCSKKKAAVEKLHGRWGSHHVGLDFKAFAIFARDVLIGARVVGDLHVDGIPFDLLAGSQRHVAEEEGFRQPAGVGEV